MFAVGGFVTMLANVPGEDADLVIVIGQAVVRISQEAEMLRDLLISILHFVESKEWHETLALRVLRDVEWDVDVAHAREDPSDAALIVADQPPILKCRARWRLRAGLSGDDFRCGRGSGLLLRCLALQQRNFRSGCELVEMLALAAWSHVEVGVIAHDSGSLHRIVLIVLRELLQTFEGLLVHEESLLDPAFKSGRGT